MTTFSEVETGRIFQGFLPSRLIITIMAAAAMLVLDALTPLGLAIWLLQVVLVWVTSLWANPRQMLTVAILCSSFIVLAFWFSPAVGLELWVGVSNLLLSLGAVWAITHMCVRQRTAEEAQKRSAAELARSKATVRMLSDLLPICSWCKKIRTEAGAWQDLETYIRNHSQANFTHGVCQECAARLSGDLDR